MAAPAPSLLLTQCLQNDFVQPLDRYDPLPNRLHVGFAEAQRLLGPDPAQGPVAQVMRWAYGEPDARLRLIHIRDWHDAADPRQREHLSQFGHHCLRDTPGAAFAFAVPDTGKDVPLISSLTLNDFEDTPLRDVLAPYAAGPRRVGLAGVWTEAKVSFLAYELRTRYPDWELAVCSALTASSSRYRHFGALDQLERILGVRVLDSIGEFVQFLGGSGAAATLGALPERHPTIEAPGLTLGDTDRTLVRWLFRDCRTVKLQTLDGGFSGNVVAGTRSVDLHGHAQVPHVVKIGARGPIGQERTAFERIQEVLGNNAPQVSEFADLGERGAIKYRYASMGEGFSTTLQKQYRAGMPMAEVRRVLTTVFGEQLARLYQAATRESCDLLAYYQFDAKWAPGVRRRVEAILGGPQPGATITLAPGITAPNPCRFYEETLRDRRPRPPEQVWQSFVHGDLNGANIILDGHGNVWLIDFFHTHRGHVLRDLAKLENDVCFIWTPVADAAAFADAVRLTDRLLEVADLGAPLPAPPPGLSPPFQRCWETLATLRGFMPGLIQSDRDPFQVWVPLLRYAAHTLGFDESDAWQKRWALYVAARCAERVTARLAHDRALRVDWIAETRTAPGRLGLTILPGRRDWGRELDADLVALGTAGVRRIVCLVPPEELERYGVPDLLAAYRGRGFAVHHLPIPDQKASGMAAMVEAVRFMDAGLRAGEAVVLHCVGGLGRTGMAAACWLRSRGVPADAALAEVRRARSPRAIETPTQEALIHAFPALDAGNA